MIELKVQDNAVLLGVKVVPGASRTRIVGEWEGRLRVAVAAAPEKGKANLELTDFLAKQIGVKKRDVEVVRGVTSPQKTIRVAGVSADAVRAALQPGRP